MLGVPVSHAAEDEGKQWNEKEQGGDREADYDLNPFGEVSSFYDFVDGSPDGFESVSEGKMGQEGMGKIVL